MLAELHRMSSALDAPKTTKSESALIIRKARKNDLVMGRSFESITTAAFLIGSRQTEHPYTLDEVVDVSRIEKKKVRSTMRKLRRELDLKIPVLKPTDIVDRMLNKIRYKISQGDNFYEFKRCVRQVVENAIDYNLHSSRDPVCVVAGAIYYVAKKRGLAGNTITQESIADGLSVSKASLRYRYQEIQDTFSR